MKGKPSELQFSLRGFPYQKIFKNRNIQPIKKKVFFVCVCLVGDAVLFIFVGSLLPSGVPSFLISLISLMLTPSHYHHQ